MVARGAAPGVTRRWVPLLALLGALLCGGVSQTFLWRAGHPDLVTVTGSQFTWVLLIFVVSWSWADGRPRPAVAAGAATGLALMVSYYAMQWLAEGAHSVAAQFTTSGGTAWTLAAVGGGAVIGLLGGLAGAPAPSRSRAKAIGIMTPAVIVGVGPLVWSALEGQYFEASRRLPVLAVFALAGLALVAATVRTCGWRACLRAGAIAFAAGAVALGGLWLLETRGWLYLTF